MKDLSPHKFHIPVMGLAYTIDTPIKVAHFGITSVISIIEDNLVEMMRKYYYPLAEETYFPITPKDENFRASRITDYLNLVNRIVDSNVKKLKACAFETGSEINKYFDMLPNDHELRKIYSVLPLSRNQEEKSALERLLRNAIKPGEIEVNIMTKVDKNQNDENGIPIQDGSDALSALKGYADSELVNSSVVFSAGMNPRLFNYMERFSTFDAKEWGTFDKKIVIKVSDYRSALIQGKMLAKKGLWVSEFRIESGLNCGGHAFATEGYLLGPILEEFKSKKEELTTALFDIYNPAAEARGMMVYDKPHPIKLTVQGGIGTYMEDVFLHNYYGIDSTGWGTPFLLCPEATTVDEETMQKLSKASEKDVVLSKSSPLGVRFNYLKNMTAEVERLKRIEKGFPGSPCTEKYLASNTEFTDEPICTASRKYQKFKIEQLKAACLPKNDYLKQLDEVLSKECLCIGLSNSASKHYGTPFVKNLHGITICPGPNIINFAKVVSLKEMTDHIYGRANILSNNDRPHMFIKELQLYVSYIQEQVNECENPDAKTLRYNLKFCNNLFEGIDYYSELLETNPEYFHNEEIFAKQLQDARKEINILLEKVSISTAGSENE